MNIEPSPVYDLLTPERSIESPNPCTSRTGAPLAIPQLFARDYRHRSYPPRRLGLCSLTRGIADQMPYGDDLLIWFHAAGRERGEHVGYWCAARVITSCWTCTTLQALAIIHDAMDCVITRHGPPSGRSARAIGMRKNNYLKLRAECCAWLRVGIMHAECAYAIAADEREPPTPASRHN